MQKIFTSPDIDQINTLQVLLRDKGIRVVINGHHDWFSVWVSCQSDASAAKVVIANLEIGAIKKEVQSTQKVWACISTTKSTLRSDRDPDPISVRETPLERKKISTAEFAVSLQTVQRFEIELRRQKLFTKLALHVIRRFQKTPIEGKLSFSDLHAIPHTVIGCSERIALRTIPRNNSTGVLKSIQQQNRYAEFIETINDKRRFR